VLFIRIVRLNLLDVVDVIWELNALTGAGYTKGLQKEQILLESQIIAVANAYEAMISHRPYRPSLGKQASIEKLSRNTGLLYNADAMDVCLNVLSKNGFDFNDGNANGARQKE
jgi:HD-GYP domain-containing protein (c-di-GMP phosphodiesterase class II)